ncbi:MAG TPA: hypothetical protein VNN80_19275 [Polyangiaceae bacterium]|jgi:hypothetical protein|nr:hypothetical protein [Polyangiaceae bacterium]
MTGVASSALRLAGVAVLLVGALLIFGRLLRSRAALCAGASPKPIDEQWLERHLFSLKPELVGALYDRRIAWPEVAAVLARMSVESKLASRVAAGARGWSNLELWLLVEREELTGYERELVESLFLTRKTTSGDAIREAYRGVGFDPARILRRHLKASCDALLGARPVCTWPLGLGLAVSFVGLVLSARPGLWGLVPVVGAIILGALGPLLALLLGAVPWRTGPEWPGAPPWAVVLCGGGSVGALALLIVAGPSLAPLGVASFTAWGLMGAALVARVVTARESAEGQGLRRNLLAARQFFAAELERSEPRIEDDWLPYLIALDLKGKVEHWYLAFGRLETAARRERLAQAAAAVDSAASGAAAAGGWTGGAGALGGVGPSGAWISATTGLRVTVPGRRLALGQALGYA